jgi:hypothetical protein
MSMSRVRSGSGEQGPEQPEPCMKVAEGCREIIMQRSKSGLYSVDLLVRLCLAHCSLACLLDEEEE